MRDRSVWVPLRKGVVLEESKAQDRQRGEQKPSPETENITQAMALECDVQQE